MRLPNSMRPNRLVIENDGKYLRLLTFLDSLNIHSCFCRMPPPFSNQYLQSASASTTNHHAKINRGECKRMRILFLNGHRHTQYYFYRWPRRIHARSFWSRSLGLAMQQPCCNFVYCQVYPPIHSIVRSILFDYFKPSQAPSFYAPNNYSKKQ